MSFGERHGLKMEAGMDRNTMVLTDRRLIRLSRVGSNWDVVFVSLEDTHAAEVRVISRSKRPLLRVALLVAGAGAALAAIDFFPISLILAAALGMGGGYRLFHYLTVSHEGSILFRAGGADVEISFLGNMTDQAYTFVNRFSQLKASSSSASGVGQEDGIEAEALPGQGRLGADEAGTGAVMDQNSKNTLETHEEEPTQEEPAKSLKEEADTSQIWYSK